MPDHSPVRQARRLATLIAVPVALIAGFVAFQMLKPSPPATGPVSMTAAPLDERQSVVCRALLSQLPDKIRDLPQRPVTAGVEQNAAYGDPPITVACGGAVASYAPTDWVYPLNGVCWHADSSGTRWTTVDREVPVTVVVPKEYDPPAQWVIVFSQPITSTIVSVPGPTGCTAQ